MKFLAWIISITTCFQYAKANLTIYDFDERLTPSWSSHENLNSYLPAIGAFIHNNYLHQGLYSTVVKAPSLQVKENICSDQRFAEEISPASCSGFLVAPDIVMTSAHCLIPKDTSFISRIWHRIFNNNPQAQNRIYKRRIMNKCKNRSWVFNFNDRNNELIAEGTLVLHKIENQFVAKCQDLVYYQRAAKNNQDFVLIKLNKKIPAKYFQFSNQPTRDPEDIWMIGHPLGISAKISPAHDFLLSDSEKFYRIAIDSFRGNSGSPLVDKKMKVLGILTGGGKDLVFNKSRGCYDYYKCSVHEIGTNINCPGEKFLKIPNKIKKMISFELEQLEPASH